MQFKSHNLHHLIHCVVVVVAVVVAAVVEVERLVVAFATSVVVQHWLAPA